MTVAGLAWAARAEQATIEELYSDQAIDTWLAATVGGYAHAVGPAEWVAPTMMALLSTSIVRFEATRHYASLTLR